MKCLFKVLTLSVVLIYSSSNINAMHSDINYYQDDSKFLNNNITDMYNGNSNINTIVNNSVKDTTNIQKHNRLNNKYNTINSEILQEITKHSKNLPFTNINNFACNIF